MKAKILGLICIICMVLATSGCCSLARQAFSDLTATAPGPTATPVATLLPTAIVSATPAYTATPTAYPSGPVRSYQVTLAAESVGNKQIKITNLGGPGALYVSKFTMTNNGRPVNLAGLTAQAGSNDTYETLADTNRIIVTGIFTDDTHKILLDTTLQM